MVKGKVVKIETLQDGSVKLSVRVEQGEIYQAIPLNQQEVTITLGIVKQTDFRAVIELLEEIKKMILRSDEAMNYRIIKPEKNIYDGITPEDIIRIEEENKL